MSPMTSVDPLSLVYLICKSTEATLPKTAVKSFHNQKPWITRIINTRTAAYNFGLQSENIDDYKVAAYNVRRAVKEAKGDYGKKVELQFQEVIPEACGKV